MDQTNGTNTCPNCGRPFGDTVYTLSIRQHRWTGWPQGVVHTAVTSLNVCDQCGPQLTATVESLKERD